MRPCVTGTAGSGAGSTSIRAGEFDGAAAGLDVGPAAGCVSDLEGARDGVASLAGAACLAGGVNAGAGFASTLCTTGAGALPVDCGTTSGVGAGTIAGVTGAGLLNPTVGDAGVADDEPVGVAFGSFPC